jgi:hypothetical protein
VSIFWTCGVNTCDLLQFPIIQSAFMLAGVRVY